MIIILFYRSPGQTNDDPSLKVCGVLLDLSKGFDRFRDEGLLYKLGNNRINGDLLDLTESILHDRCQSVA